MYDFEKIPGEYIISIVDDVILKENEKERNISVILTNKRLLFLDYPSGVNNYEEMVRISRGINYMRKKKHSLSLD